MKLVAKIALIILLAFPSYIVAQAQNSDFVVYFNGDTLYGSIKRQSGKWISNQIIFRHNDKKELLRSTQVRAFYVAKDDENYHTIRINNRYEFMKLIVGGFVSLYDYQHRGTNSSAMEVSKILVKRDGRTLESGSIGFRKRTSDFLEECETVKQAIIDKQYKAKDLVRIVEDFNACIKDLQSQNQLITVIQAPPTQEASEIGDLLEAFKVSIEDYDIDAKQDLIDITTDIEDKVLKGEKVSNYLLKSFTEIASGHKDLKAKAEAIVAKINQ
ncbi:hypothetical protein QQ008_20345 [Fulvivirgaceae bacterium BMA10]|uniref:Uncharacterized protein n=1 Tax=Splendidivirga corallicola TaxID=3051826 RepID=A0ABT8KSM2_9BACT|nr:hypothetical protein [Fulvivirgaceae bacterium BMA10]